jgi:Xaa-Pro dipeptidase
MVCQGLFVVFVRLVVNMRIPDVYRARREKLAAWMKENSVSLVVLSDFEDARDLSLRYLSGHPQDALLFVSDAAQSLLVPWDINLAQKHAHADKIAPYSAYGRKKAKTAAAVAAELGLSKGANIEFSSQTAYPEVKKIEDALHGYNVLCRDKGFSVELKKHRAKKDDAEIALYRKLCALTDRMSEDVIGRVISGQLRTEADIALFIEKRCREEGCEGTGFDTLCAGAERSFGIHCFPSWTGAEFAGAGLSILDYGLVLEGYTSDVTLAFARGHLSKKQEEMLALVEEAAERAFRMAAPGASSLAIAKNVEGFFKESGFEMPHGLGHGIGLEAHEYPAVNTVEEYDTALEPGFVFTLEPGLYDGREGGCRLENDILITETGAEKLTHSRIVRM